MSRKLLLLFIVLSFAPMVLFGQSTGKIIGVIKDKASGDPLPGVNIGLEGTTMGAASDADGYFVILNVPVGVYNVSASFIGYKEVTQTGLRVSASITTDVNFTMEEAAVEGEEVIIVGSRPLVEKNVTSGVSLVTSEELENIPVRGFNDIVATQKSVVVQDNLVYIRGGRADEVGYYIDGASSVNPLTNTQSIYVIREAVEEFQVLAGGFTAEFGGANAGIIRTELKTGGSNYSFSADFQTDKFADEGETFLGTNSFRHHNLILSASGPLLSNKVRFFAAFENAYQGDRAVRFGEGFTFTNLTDQNPSAVGTPETIDEYTYPDGFTPQREEEQLAFQSTLLFDLSPLQVRLSGSWSDRSRQFNSVFFQNQGGSSPDTPVLNQLNDRTYDDTFQNLLLSGKLTYVLSPTSLLEANFNYFDSKLDREDSYFGNDWRKWNDSTAVAQHTGGEVTYASRYRAQPNYLFNGIYFARNGAPTSAYRVQDQQYIGGAINFLTQAGRHHELKIGGDVRMYKLRRFAVATRAISQLDVDQTAGTIENLDPNAWVNASAVNNYGYDIFGNESDSDEFTASGFQTSQAPNEPVFGAFFIQDKIEYNDLIINAGLRLDYFDSKSRTLVDELDPAFDPVQRIFDEDAAWQDKDAAVQVSPRLGFSFPVSERTVFYANYGKFLQMPELETMYAGVHIFNDAILVGGTSNQNPVGYGLDPIKTTSYEIGFRQQLGNVAALDIGGFYRNVKGQIQVDKIFPTNSALGPFNVLTNGDFATTKGVELGITLRRVNRLQGQFNYTLSSAQGTNSTRNSDVAVLELNSTNRPSTISPLDFNQVHRGSIIMDYRWGRDEGGPLLSNLGVNGLFTFNSGHAYTYTESKVGQASAYDSGVDYMNDTRSRRALEPIGASTTPFNFNFDLQLDKAINVISSVETKLYMRVNNLFNTKNVINVFNNTGSATDDGFIQPIDQAASESRQAYVNAFGEEYINTYNAVNIDNGQAYWDVLGLQLFDSPRQIFFGIKLSY
ncbi:MAG: TonB-dependent receptor [Calditrichia bacterium]